MLTRLFSALFQASS